MLTKTEPSERAAYGLGTNGLDRISNLAWDSEPGQRNAQSHLYKYAAEVGGSGEGRPNLVWGDYPSKSLYIADVEALTIEAYTEFITGSRDVATEWDEFVAEMNKAGLLELTKDAQAWWDTFQ